MKKAIISVCLLVAMLIPMASVAYAADEQHTAMPSVGIDEGTTRRYAFEGTDVSTISEPGISPFGVVAPTAYAPASWYGVNHEWSCASYTYSSYIFQSSKAKYLDIRGLKPFTVEFYSPSGTLLNTFTATNSGGTYSCDFYLYDSSVGHFDFYLIIRSNSNSANSSTYYKLWGTY